MKAAPAWNNTIEMTPVDIVGRAVVELSLKENLDFQTFNLSNPNQIKWTDYIKVLKDCGLDITLVDIKTWETQYLSKIDETNAIYPFKESYMNVLREKRQNLPDLTSNVKKNTKIIKTWENYLS